MSRAAAETDWQSSPTLRRLTLPPLGRWAVLGGPIVGVAGWMIARLSRGETGASLVQALPPVLLGYVVVTAALQLTLFESLWEGDLERYDHARASLWTTLVLLACGGAIARLEGGSPFFVLFGAIVAAGAGILVSACAGGWQLVKDVPRFLRWNAAPHSVAASAMREAAAALRRPPERGATLHLLIVARRAASMAITADSKRRRPAQARGLVALRDPVVRWLDGLQDVESQAQPARDAASSLLDLQAENVAKGSWDALVDAVSRVKAKTIRARATQQRRQTIVHVLGLAMTVGALLFTVYGSPLGTVRSPGALNTVRVALVGIIVSLAFRLVVIRGYLSAKEAAFLQGLVTRLRRLLGQEKAR